MSTTGAPTVPKGTAVPPVRASQPPAAGGTVLEVAQHFTASASPEGAGWRIWCNQALGVSFLVDDLEDGPARMVQALAQAKDLDPADVRVTMVSTR